MNIFLGICTVLGGIAAAWYFRDKIMSFFKKEPVPTPTKEMSRSTAGQVGLESYLKDEGYRLYWGSVDKKEEYLHFDDYELIEWKDDKGQNWILSNSPRGDLPLMTRFSSKEIETRKKERKQEH